MELGVHGIDSAEGATTGLLSAAQPPTALFTGQNLITIGAYRALRKMGLQRRVALVGFDVSIDFDATAIDAARSDSDTSGMAATLGRG